MVGEGPEKEKAEWQCEKLGIKNRVLFLGNSNEIDRILCFSDLFLLPSEFESFGLAALEAMVNKVAVISSNSGGIPEVNRHGITGFLSNVGDIDDMVKNALYLLEDDEILQKFKENAYKVALEFDITNILPLYEAVYEQAYKANYKNSY
jgi:glycosyltransferase involved in cell wall biosynthesis